jgi:putative glutamine amidotransferase
MRPIVLTNAFRRPRGIRSWQGLALCNKTHVYACIEDIVDVIHQDVEAMPLLLPTTHDRATARQLLAQVDGIILPGGYSNIHPRRYGAEPHERPQIFDEAHDDTDLFLIKTAVELGIPLLGICRGMQGINVAFGGSLDQDIKQGGRLDHFCSVATNGTNLQPGHAHGIALQREGLLADILRNEAHTVVNSLHEQGIDRLGEGLVAEAMADDGVVEAISCPAAKGFLLGVQWHPERVPENPVSHRIFAAFGAAVRQHYDQRVRQQDSSESPVPAVAAQVSGQ